MASLKRTVSYCGNGSKLTAFSFLIVTGRVMLNLISTTIQLMSRSSVSEPDTLGRVERRVTAASRTPPWSVCRWGCRVGALVNLSPETLMACTIRCVPLTNGPAITDVLRKTSRIRTTRRCLSPLVTFLR